MQIAQYEKSLAYLYPEKLAEWDYQKNNILPEKIFSKNSTEQIWWLCPKCNHSYSATLSNRIGRKSGCPKCSLIVIGVKKSTPKEGESLLERFPEICKDWSSNNKTSPKQYYPFSHKKVLWFCKKCKKDYLGSIGHKVGKRGCPRCKEKYVGKCNSTPKIGESLLDLYPEICKEWSIKMSLDRKLINVHVIPKLGGNVLNMTMNGRQHQIKGQCK
jgi:predicted metal-binding protein